MNHNFVVMYRKDAISMFTGKEYVLEVYKEKNFTKAAKNLYISQPSLSASIKRIEEKIGSPIFDRSSHPLGLTECGKYYIDLAEKIMEIEGNFSRYLDDLHHLKTGTVSIGGSNLYSSYVLPPLIAEYTQRYPSITVRLVEDTTAQLKKHLLDGSVDIIIDNITYDDSSFDKYSYQLEHILLVVPKNFTINQQLEKYQLTEESILSGTFLNPIYPEVPISYFSQEPFILLKQENDTYTRGVELCRLGGFEPKILMQPDQQVTAYNITCSGLGVCFASDTLVRSTLPHPNAVYYKLPLLPSSRHIYFYLKSSRYVTFAISEFLNLIRSRETV